MHSLEILFILLASLQLVMELPSNGCSILGDIEYTA
jgi:hypothetical protein